MGVFWQQWQEMDPDGSGFFLLICAIIIVVGQLLIYRERHRR